MKTSEEKNSTEKKNTDSKEEKRRPGKLLVQIAIYYGLMMTLYLYFMLANLSSSPKYVYTQF